MGIRAHVQVKWPEYGNCRMSSWGSHAAWRYLVGEGIDIYTGDDNGADSDSWEIQIPSIERMEEIVRNLRANPNALDSDCDECRGRYAGELADLLDEGISAAKSDGYDYIIVEWY